METVQLITLWAEKAPLKQNCLYRITLCIWEASLHKSKLIRVIFLNKSEMLLLRCSRLMVSDLTEPVRQVVAYDLEQDLEDDTVINELEWWIWIST